MKRAVATYATALFFNTSLPLNPFYLSTTRQLQKELINDWQTADKPTTNRIFAAQETKH